MRNIKRIEQQKLNNYHSNSGIPTIHRGPLASISQSTKHFKAKPHRDFVIPVISKKAVNPEQVNIGQLLDTH
tara:strand:+ start:614 stop:829 length:216 start_codon:yes stop_codon:yes gene_type:complete